MTTTSGSERLSVHKTGTDRSLGELVATASADISALFRKEVELAKIEIKSEVKNAGKGAGAFGAAGFTGLLAIIFLSIAAAYGLSWLYGDHVGLGFLTVERDQCVEAGSTAVPVVLMPGNPVSCLCAYEFFAGPIIRRLGGRPGGWPHCALQAPLARKLASVVGRVDYARVRIERGRVEPLAVSGASILSSTTRADGFVIITADLEGYAAGTTVTVMLYDEALAARPIPAEEE